MLFQHNGGKLFGPIFVVYTRFLVLALSQLQLSKSRRASSETLTGVV